MGSKISLGYGLRESRTPCLLHCSATIGFLSMCTCSAHFRRDSLKKICWKAWFIAAIWEIIKHSLYQLCALKRGELCLALSWGSINTCWLIHWIINSYQVIYKSITDSYSLSINLCERSPGGKSSRSSLVQNDLLLRHCCSSSHVNQQTRKRPTTASAPHSNITLVASCSLILSGMPGSSELNVVHTELVTHHFWYNYVPSCTSWLWCIYLYLNGFLILIFFMQRHLNCFLKYASLYIIGK